MRKRHLPSRKGRYRADKQPGAGPGPIAAAKWVRLCGITSRTSLDVTSTGGRRVCGVTDAKGNELQILKGLSTRVRRYLGEPAIADDLPEVYRRVCGVTLATSPHRYRYAGLSPRVRRYRVVAEGPGSPIGSIAACAALPTIITGTGEKPEVYRRVCGVTGYWRPNGCR